ncbi:MAG: PQQ-dependent sugar dehydrogenase [Myxococcota bacterium]|nr:PQQ-dependent sugar dehydrogenase [Myxococcota bacterium]
MKAWLCLLVFVIACNDEDRTSLIFVAEDGTVTADGINREDAGAQGRGPEADMGMSADEGLSDLGTDPSAYNPYRPRVSNPSCRLPEPPPVGEYSFERAFPNLTFERPVWIGTAPHDNETLFVVEQGGLIRTFDNQTSVREARTFFDLSVSRRGNEEGLLGLAFHPQYASNGRFYVHYSAGQDRCGGASRCSIISEFRRANAGVARLDSERRLLVVPQPFSNHNGGALNFGPDGFLYISLGDGGAAGDPLGHGQNTDTLLGSILRIDVTPSQGRAYSIPANNPFVNGGGRPEIWTWGVRNVWRMSFDQRTGSLWAADVGQNRYEEIHRISGPGNLGWNIREGFECFAANQCRSDGLQRPIYAYDHGEGESITGGLLYRGQRLPELWGKYLFADYESGRVWALDSDADESSEARLLGVQSRITHFGEDLNGNLFLTSFSSGIVRLVRRSAVEVNPFPTRLSDTGCFTDTSTHRMTPGVIPYFVNLPFWADGLSKARYIAIPDGTQVRYRDEDSFEMPTGTVLIKTFLEPHPDAEPRRIETRMWTRFGSGWRGFTWKWRPDQSDADLITSGELVSIEIDGQTSEWPLLDSMDCERCHTQAAGSTLGWSKRQLHGLFEYPGGQASQLYALAEAGYLDMPDDAVLVSHPRPDQVDVALDERARARLHVDCASCHRPGGFANARLDLRVTTSLEQTGLCAIASQGQLDTTDGLLLDPGHPNQSVLLLRMSRRDGEGMPPIGSNRVHGEGQSLVRDWIQSLTRCPTE